MPPRTHGMSRGPDGKSTKEYKAWCGIKDRCTNPHNQYWHCYGGRGIKMHPEWLLSFQEFLKSVGTAPSKDHSIGRIDNDGDYTPGNVSWQTIQEQNANKRDLPRTKWKSGPLLPVVLQLASQGITTRKIALIVGLSHSWIARMIRENR